MCLTVHKVGRSAKTPCYPMPGWTTSQSPRIQMQICPKSQCPSICGLQSFQEAESPETGYNTQFPRSHTNPPTEAVL